MNLDELEKLIELMVKHRVHRLRTDTGAEIELGEAAFSGWKTATPPQPFDDTPERGDECNCLHESFEHSDEGLCLRGCSPSACARNPGPPTVP